MPKNPETILLGQFYHIYNRGNNGETLFREERNYLYFLNLYQKYIPLVAETYAYCLLGNHFHLLVRIKDRQLSQEGQFNNPSRAFADLFSTYTKSVNKAYRRTGSLFEKPFRRKLVDSDQYFCSLAIYIHRNPQRHGFIDDFRRWPYSSFQAIRSDKATHLQRQVVLEWFGGIGGYDAAHNAQLDQIAIEPVIFED